MATSKIFDLGTLMKNFTMQKDGKLFGCTDEKQNVILFNLSNKEIVSNLNVEYVKHIEFQPNGFNFLLGMGSSDDSCKVQLYDLRMVHKNISEIKFKYSDIKTLKYSPSGKYIGIHRAKNFQEIETVLIESSNFQKNKFKNNLNIEYSDSMTTGFNFLSEDKIMSLDSSNILFLKYEMGKKRYSIEEQIKGHRLG